MQETLDAKQLAAEYLQWPETSSHTDLGDQRRTVKLPLGQLSQLPVRDPLYSIQ